MGNGPGGWAASGAMAITGDGSGPPLAPPGPLAGALDALAAELADLTGVTVDGPALLGERAALTHLRRHGQRSCGDHSRLLPTADGWVAVGLARPDDIAMLPALLERDLSGESWEALACALRSRPTAEVVERAALLGIPAGALPAAPLPAPPAAVDVTGHAGRPRSLADCTIADLSALWAGPLCSGLLGRGGARVVKVETAERPDRARHGNRRLWRLLNGNKEDRTVDRTRLRDEIDAADIVVLSSRRRAYEQLGIDVDDVLRARTDKVVVAITGHGWRDDRVGFGDDAAVAGGLVARHPVDGAPRFLADAIADPLTGLHAAVAAARCATAGGQWFVDAALARVSGAMAAVACAHEPALAATRRRRGWVLETAEGDWPVAPPRARAT